MEIERKYLVHHDLWAAVQKPNPKIIKQGYLYKDKEKSVRIRIKDQKGYITIKSSVSVISREEFEYEIPLADAEKMLKLTCPKVLSKKRFEIPYLNHLIEVDVFEGKLEGLILAEIELKDENEEIYLPNWIDKEVSDDQNYLNVHLIELC